MVGGPEEGHKGEWPWAEEPAAGLGTGHGEAGDFRWTPWDEAGAFGWAPWRLDRGKGGRFRWIARGPGPRRDRGLRADSLGAGQRSKKDSQVDRPGTGQGSRTQVDSLEAGQKPNWNRPLGGLGTGPENNGGDLRRPA